MYCSNFLLSNARQAATMDPNTPLLFNLLHRHLYLIRHESRSSIGDPDLLHDRHLTARVATKQPLRTGTLSHQAAIQILIGDPRFIAR
jgi:hypothetical protein